MVGNDIEYLNDAKRGRRPARSLNLFAASIATVYSERLLSDLPELGKKTANSFPSCSAALWRFPTIWAFEILFQSLDNFEKFERFFSKRRRASETSWTFPPTLAIIRSP